MASLTSPFAPRHPAPSAISQTLASTNLNMSVNNSSSLLVHQDIMLRSSLALTQDMLVKLSPGPMALSNLSMNDLPLSDNTPASPASSMTSGEVAMSSRDSPTNDLPQSHNTPASPTSFMASVELHLTTKIVQPAIEKYKDPLDPFAGAPESHQGGIEWLIWQALICSCKGFATKEKWEDEKILAAKASYVCSTTQGQGIPERMASSFAWDYEGAMDNVAYLFKFSETTGFKMSYLSHVHILVKVQFSAWGVLKTATTLLPEDFEERMSFQLHNPGEIIGIDFDSTSNRFAIANRNGTVVLFSVESPMVPLGSISIQHHVLKALTFGKISGNCRCRDLLVFGLGGQIYILKHQDEKLLIHTTLKVAFGEDGRVVVSGSNHRVVYVYKRRTGLKMNELKVNLEDWVQTLATMHLKEIPCIMAARSRELGGNSQIYIWEKGITDKNKIQVFNLKLFVSSLMCLANLGFVYQNIVQEWQYLNLKCGQFGGFQVLC
ncbi:hypothetical protein IW262DRAFT_1297697 [Armillaria fumosa]|nr:hypothetical protein IW262DRAFT_1297697 [Armillaria fumosa]